jgi:catalase
MECDQVRPFSGMGLGLQLFDQDFADKFDFDVLDATKIIPEEELPIRKVGRLVLDRCVDNFFSETEQVAFCTANVVPGVDFSNDPLLQGRNFSYLDTQVKRLGGPNFTYLSVNAPKCPMHTLQQDGHMASVNPKTRVNYEPNSWGGEPGGPRESPDRGFESYPAPEEGPKLRIRSETFADHYSQARQFYASQTKVEQEHIAASFTFELSKVENPLIRGRLVSHLLNVDKGLADGLAKALRLKTTPKPAEPARSPRTDLKALRSLSISLNPPPSFEGRKVGVVVSDGVNAELLKALRQRLDEEGASLEVVAPTIGGVEASDGVWVEAHQTISGGPSVLYDAVTLIVSDEATVELANDPAARDFICDAFAHSKFIAYVPSVLPLLKATLGDQDLDAGFVRIERAKDVTTFVEDCRRLRFWERTTEPVTADKKSKGE